MCTSYIVCLLSPSRPKLAPNTASLFSSGEAPAALKTLFIPRNLQGWASWGLKIFSALALLDKVPSQTGDELGPVWESRCLTQVGGPGHTGLYLNFQVHFEGLSETSPRLVSLLRLLGRTLEGFFLHSSVLLLLWRHSSNKAKAF